MDHQPLKQKLWSTSIFSVALSSIFRVQKRKKKMDKIKRVPTLPSALPPVGTNGLTMTPRTVENNTTTKCNGCNGTNALTAVVGSTQQSVQPQQKQQLQTTTTAVTTTPVNSSSIITTTATTNNIISSSSSNTTTTTSTTTTTATTTINTSSNATSSDNNISCTNSNNTVTTTTATNITHNTSNNVVLVSNNTNTNSTTTTSTTPAKRSTKDYIFGHVIGEGSFSTVYLTKDIHSSKEYAIKVCEKRHIMREKKSEYVKREKDVLNILSSAQAPFFVKLYCTFQDTERLYFVLSYAKNGELLQYINKLGNFDIACTRFYAGEILLALEHLHRLGIIHRDLKPENILLDDKMHILITDFGSAKIVSTPETNGVTPNGEQDKQTLATNKQCQPPPRRRNSFVGTAQYVSPELLTDKTARFASDLWALGCIIYQMISGLPPFRARSEYAIFQKIIKLEYDFPEGFDSDAQDIVQKLLVVNANERLGAQDVDGYPSIRNHPMFNGLDFDNITTMTPPTISPFLPLPSSNIKVPDHLEPGLDKQLSRLLGLESEQQKETPVRKKSGVTNILTAPELAKTRLEDQRQTSKWHQLVGGHLILKQGIVNKRKGLFARRRMLLLTEGPHLYYVDPDSMTLKGEIPWSQQISAEPKNFKIFFVHTPSRTYYLEDPEGYALEWCKAIDEVKIFMSAP